MASVVSLEPEALPPLTRLARALGLIGLEAASIGFGVWIFRSRDVLPGLVRQNDLESGLRRYAFIDIGLGLLAGGVVATGLFVWKRRAALEPLQQVALRLSPLSLVWLVPLLFDRRLWMDQDLLVLPMVAAFGWGLVAAFRASWEAGSVLPEVVKLRIARFLRGRTRLEPAFAALAKFDTPAVVVILGAVSYGAYFSCFTIVKHRNLGTNGFDLGLEDNLMWHVVHPSLPLFRSTPFSGPTGSHFGNHATWFAYVIAPIYAIIPRPETLLVLQAFLIGAAAIPLFLYARKHVPPWTAAVVAYAYLLYPPLHGANLYDFHYLPLGLFFLWATLYAIEANRRALAVVGVVLAMSVREDVSACLAVMGAFLLLTGAAPRAGALIAALAGFYFVGMKLYVMPTLGHTNDASFAYMYAGLAPKDDAGFGGVLKTVASNPAFTAGVVLEREKIVYLFQILTPVLLLPLTRPVGFVLAVPGFLFTLLATGYWPLYQPSFQYTSYWTAFVFVGVVAALEHAGKARYPGDGGSKTRQRALVAGFVGATLACTYLDGAIWNQKDVRGGFGRVSWATSKADLDNRAYLAALVSRIAPKDRVAATDHLLAHVSTRDCAYMLGQGTFDADWLLFDGNPRDGERRNALEGLKSGTFGVVDERGSMVLARRGAETSANAPVVRRLSK